jgi:hypothetical protein
MRAERGRLGWLLTYHRGEGFLGVVLLETSHDFVAAVRLASERGCHRAGSVTGYDVSYDRLERLPEHVLAALVTLPRNTLLSQDEVVPLLATMLRVAATSSAARPGIAAVRSGTSPEPMETIASLVEQLRERCRSLARAKLALGAQMERARRAQLALGAQIERGRDSPRRRSIVLPTP